VWGVHLLPRIGGYQLREITPMVVEDLRDQMTHAKVGAPTQRKALMLLQGILRRAVVRGLMPVNPAQLVDTLPSGAPHAAVRGMTSWSFRARRAGRGRERTGPTGAGAFGDRRRSRRGSQVTCARTVSVARSSRCFCGKGTA
jgi:hypothetical protein